MVEDDLYCIPSSDLLGKIRYELIDTTETFGYIGSLQQSKARYYFDGYSD